MGAFGKGQRNEKGNRQIGFAEEYEPIVANQPFQKPKTIYGTLESPDGETKNQILPCVTKEE